MCTMAMPFDPWCVDYHKTMAAAATVGTAIKRGASVLEIARDFWSTQRKFKSLLSDLDKLRDVPVDELASFVPRLRDLYGSVNRILDLAGKRGYTNRTLINGSIQSLRARNADLQDIIERFELSLDPSFAPAVAAAIAEFERGETIALESLLQ